MCKILKNCGCSVLPIKSKQWLESCRMANASRSTGQVHGTFRLRRVPDFGLTDFEIHFQRFPLFVFQTYWVACVDSRSLERQVLRAIQMLLGTEGGRVADGTWSVRKLESKQQTLLVVKSSRQPLGHAPCTVNLIHTPLSPSQIPGTHVPPP